MLQTISMLPSFPNHIWDFWKTPTCQNIFDKRIPALSALALSVRKSNHKESTHERMKKMPIKVKFQNWVMNILKFLDKLNGIQYIFKNRDMDISEVYFKAN